jgi:hypothetical protein
LEDFMENRSAFTVIAAIGAFVAGSVLFVESGAASTPLSAFADRSLTVTDLGTNAAPTGANILMEQRIGDDGGNTRFRLQTDRAWDVGGQTPQDWSPEYPDYLKPRDRDLGQVFNTGNRTMLIDSIVLKVGPMHNAIQDDGLNAAVSMQFMSVSGTPTINDNGTTTNFNNPYITWTNDHRSDDFIEGLSFEHVALASGGVLPSTLNNNHYMRWSFDTPFLAEANTRYAFLVMYDEPAESRGMALANWNRVGKQQDKTDHVEFGHAIRREGHAASPGTLAWEGNWWDRPELPGNPNTSSEWNKSGDWNTDNWNAQARLHQEPGGFGKPDVDTYRDFVFFLEGSLYDALMNGVSLTVLDGRGANAMIGSGNEASRTLSDPTSVDHDGRLRVRNDSTGGDGRPHRKAYFRFDLDEGITGERVTDARLSLTVSSASGSLPTSLLLWGLADGHAGDLEGGWLASAITGNNAPGNDNSTASGAGNLMNTNDGAIMLGSINVNGLTVDSQVVFDETSLGEDAYAALLAFLQDDTNGLVTFMITSGSAHTSSLEFYSTFNYDGDVSRLATLTVIPEPGSLVLLALGALAGLTRRRT